MLAFLAALIYCAIASGAQADIASCYGRDSRICCGYRWRTQRRHVKRDNRSAGVAELDSQILRFLPAGKRS